MDSGDMSSPENGVTMKLMLLADKWDSQAAIQLTVTFLIFHPFHNQDSLCAILHVMGVKEI
jgi:hypothetical protein